MTHFEWAITFEIQWTSVSFEYYFLYCGPHSECMWLFLHPISKRNRENFLFLLLFVSVRTLFSPLWSSGMWLILYTCKYMYNTNCLNTCKEKFISGMWTCRCLWLSGEQKASWHHFGHIWSAGVDLFDLNYYIWYLKMADIVQRLMLVFGSVDSASCFYMLHLTMHAPWTERLCSYSRHSDHDLGKVFFPSDTT